MFIEVMLFEDSSHSTSIFINTEDISVVLPLVNSVTKKEIGLALTMRTSGLQVLKTTSYTMATFGSLLNAIRLTKKVKK